MSDRAAAITRWVPETRDPNARDARLDLGGAALSAVVLGAVSYAFIEGPENGFSVFEIAIAAVGVLGAGALWWVERRRDHPMLPLDLFSDRVFAVANLLTFVIYGGVGVLFFLLSVQLQVTAGWTPLQAGTALLPVTVILLMLSSRAGALSQRIGPRLPLTIGPLVVAGGMVMMTRVGPDASYFTDVFPAVTVFGFGLAGIVAPVTITALEAVPDERAGAASGTNNAVARTGGLLAVAAIPGLVGLTGDALSDPRLLDPGFEQAMRVSAAIVASGGLLSLLLLRSDDLTNEPSNGETPPPGSTGHVHRLHHHSCPVDGQLTSIAGTRSDARE